ncbi:MAG: extracellular solute-binding protein [Phycisphaerae bacterium]
MFHELIQCFQKGFAGLNRDEAVFRFAQQQAVFINAGTWDIMSLVEQAKGQFEVGVISYPQPAKDDPDYGALVLGPFYDPAGPAFPFGVTRHSRHPELAKDFLRFLASKQGNQRLNEIIGWIPSISGVPLPAVLAQFAPVNQGQYACFNTDLGGETYIKNQQLFSRLQTDPQYHVADYIAEFEAFYKEHGLRDWHEQQRDWRRAIINNDKFLAGLRGEALIVAPDRPGDPLWIKYRTYTANRQVTPGIGRAEQVQMVESGPPRPVGPYEYLPQALDNARRVLRAATTQSH